VAGVPTDHVRVSTFTFLALGLLVQVMVFDITSPFFVNVLSCTFELGL
jgi:hypothetical protein